MLTVFKGMITIPSVTYVYLEIDLGLVIVRVVRKFFVFCTRTPSRRRDKYSQESGQDHLPQVQARRAPCSGLPNEEEAF